MFEWLCIFHPRAALDQHESQVNQNFPVLLKKKSKLKKTDVDEGQTSEGYKIGFYFSCNVYLVAILILFLITTDSFQGFAISLL